MITYNELLLENVELEINVLNLISENYSNINKDQIILAEGNVVTTKLKNGWDWLVENIKNLGRKIAEFFRGIWGKISSKFKKSGAEITKDEVKDVNLSKNGPKVEEGKIAFLDSDKINTVLIDGKLGKLKGWKDNMNNSNYKPENIWDGDINVESFYKIITVDELNTLIKNDKLIDEFTKIQKSLTEIIDVMNPIIANTPKTTNSVQTLLLKTCEKLSVIFTKINEDVILHISGIKKLVEDANEKAEDGNNNNNSEGNGDQTVDASARFDSDLTSIFDENYLDDLLYGF